MEIVRPVAHAANSKDGGEGVSEQASKQRNVLQFR